MREPHSAGRTGRRTIRKGGYVDNLGAQTITFHSGGFLGGENPDELRKRAKRIEKQRKSEKREARKQEARRQTAIAALARVANDPKRGYASVEAARELLRLNEAASDES